MAALSGHKAKLEICGATTAMTTEAFTVIAGTGNENWRITDNTKNVFDWGVTFTVEAEDPATTWNTLGAGEFTLRYLKGQVEIDNYTSGSANVANIVGVRITGNYLPKFEAVEARDANVELMTALLNASVFGNDGERRIPGRNDANISYSNLEPGIVTLDDPALLEDRLLNMIRNGTATIASIEPNRDAATPYALRVLVHIENDALSIPGGDVTQASISMVGSTKTAAMSTQTVRVWDLLEY